MANQEYLDILKQGVEAWNRWRVRQYKIILTLRSANLDRVDLDYVDLCGAYLVKADLKDADLRETNLSGADLRGADLCSVDLRKADLRGADLSGPISRDLDDPFGLGANLSHANLCWTNFSGANLQGVDLGEAKLCWTNLSGANLQGADLRMADLIETNLANANIMRCYIFGISAWNVHLEGALQKDLVITDAGDAIITVDNLEVAQFIYLLLHNKKFRDVIETIGKKVILILGRFTPERKIVLDALRDELRNHNYSPVVFDFEKPANRDLTETVSILAHLSRFIIADITDPSCIPQELYAVVPDCLVPIQPLLSNQPVLIDGKEEERRPYSMFKDLQRRYHWVLPTYKYQNVGQLLSTIKDNIITPAEEKSRELERKKNASI